MSPPEHRDGDLETAEDLPHLGPDEHRRETGRRAADAERRRWPGLEVLTGIGIVVILAGVIAIIITTILLAQAQADRLTAAVEGLSEEVGDVRRELRDPEEGPPRAEVARMAQRIEERLDELIERLDDAGIGQERQEGDEHAGADEAATAPTPRPPTDTATPPASSPSVAASRPSPTATDPQTGATTVAPPFRAATAAEEDDGHPGQGEPRAGGRAASPDAAGARCNVPKRPPPPCR